MHVSLQQLGVKLSELNIYNNEKRKNTQKYPLLSQKIQSYDNKPQYVR